MKSSLALRLLSLCLAFGLLFGTFLFSAEASSGLYVPTGEDIEIFMEDFVSEDENDFTSGLGAFFDEYLPDPLGIVNDDTGTVSYSIHYYAGRGLGGWSSDTNWTTSSDIAVNKTFAFDSIKAGYPASGVPTAYDLVTSSYFQPTIGYTISFLRGDNGNLAKGSEIALDLVFADTAPAVSDVARIFRYTSNNGSISSVQATSYSNVYTQLGLPLLDLTAKSGTNYSSTGNIVGFNQVITVGGLTVDGQDVVFNTFNDMQRLTLDVKITEEIQYLYVDVEYSAKRLNVPVYTDASNNAYVYIPYVYNFDLSGSLELDEGGVLTGLVGSIIEWLRNILNAIRELPDKIVDGIKAVLQELFVPSSEFISGKFEEFKLLAESKLGFLFTMFDMVVDLFTTLSTNISEPMETLTIPSLVLPFPYVPSGELVLWEDMTFQVFPDGLDVLLNLVHLVTSIVLITATINFSVGYIRRFFEKG